MGRKKKGRQNYAFSPKKNPSSGPADFKYLNCVNEGGFTIFE